MPHQKTPAAVWRPGQASSRSGSAFIIEVLVVISILGIMAATAAFSMDSILQRATKAARSTQTDAPQACRPRTAPSGHPARVPHRRGPLGCEPNP